MHPNCYDFGGGEKVLWMIIDALTSLKESKDFYKIKVYNKKKPEDVAFYNCSNFMNLESFNMPNSDGFFGQGDFSFTKLTYFKVPHKKLEGKYNSGLILKSAKNNANF